MTSRSLQPFRALGDARCLLRSHHTKPARTLDAPKQHRARQCRRHVGENGAKKPPTQSDSPIRDFVPILALTLFRFRQRPDEAVMHESCGARPVADGEHSAFNVAASRRVMYGTARPLSSSTRLSKREPMGAELAVVLAVNAAPSRELIAEDQPTRRARTSRHLACSAFRIRLSPHGGKRRLRTRKRGKTRRILTKAASKPH